MRHLLSIPDEPLSAAEFLVADGAHAVPAALEAEVERRGEGDDGPQGRAGAGTYRLAGPAGARRVLAPVPSLSVVPVVAVVLLVLVLVLVALVRVVAPAGRVHCGTGPGLAALDARLEEIERGRANP